MYCQTYQVAFKSTDKHFQQQNVWYLTDEVGMGIRHSDHPNIIMVPFVYATPTQEIISYSIFWPIIDLSEGDLITRDSAPKSVQGLQRRAYLSIYGSTKEDALVFQEAYTMVRLNSVCLSLVKYRSVDRQEPRRQIVTPLDPLSITKLYSDPQIPKFSTIEYVTEEVANLHWTAVSGEHFSRASKAVW